MSKKQKYKGLRLILGDQLNIDHSWYDDRKWLYVLMEIKPESEYVTHHIQKIVGIFQAMRNFATVLSNKGLEVKYFKINDTDNLQSFKENIEHLLENHNLKEWEYQEPDEWRLDILLKSISHGKMVSTEHFLTERDEVEQFFKGKKSFVMENFYRHMREKHDILMENGEPITGKWNYDKSNRKKLPKDLKVPEPFVYNHDVSEILDEVNEAKLKHIGEIDVESFIWPKDRDEAIEILKHFILNLLPHFGDYQDALTERDWSLFHSRISFAMNLKMIKPMEVIKQVEEAFHKRKEVTINTAEGFIRQILGWREYMRGLYWAKMPEYGNLNFFENKANLPWFYWNGQTKMNCMSHAIGQSLKYAYAHHIQRLMITGNFALLAGIHPDQVDEWYLGIYIDAFEWVEMPNTRGMSQFADGGIVATKPYVSSASYINKMGDYCKGCHYDYKDKTGDKACPFNSLYWNFIDQHKETLKSNHRMSMMLSVWERMGNDQQEALLKKATFYLDHIAEL